MKLLLTVTLCAAAVLNAADPLEIRVLYDNTAVKPEFRSGWGFAALVTMGKSRILFDTGADPAVFVQNFEAAGIDAPSIRSIVISHPHGDHTGGLAQMQSKAPLAKLHMPERAEPFEILPGFYSTGTLNGPPVEQALAIETGKGLVVITGCSHPGVAQLVEAAVKQRTANCVRFLLGGFHMLSQSQAQIDETIARLRKLNVDRIAPTHCTGKLATESFRAAFGEKFETAGAGKVFVLE